MNIALILSGGTGKRLGSDIPKQYISVKGSMIITRCLLKVLECKKIDGIHIVADEKWRDRIVSEMKSEGVESSVLKGFSDPGKTRQLSILNGLYGIREYAKPKDIVIVHDAARPNVSEALLNACVDECKFYDGVIPVLPMKDTVYLSNDGTSITRVLDRSRIYAGQAPEAFRLGKYIEANERLIPDDILNINGTTEPAVLAGLNVCMIHGEESNYKITTKEDLDRYISSVGSRGILSLLK
ncbi:MAG: 2-C-methyl-D-erythritol 4-phosphate cytidylyltransferase [Lachnospiraceae bacterium]|nr:2-C-methyl-D-erythritol 4-phosphate cytidylyltransferase [Lachnospiraceae bacterium]